MGKIKVWMKKPAKQSFSKAIREYCMQCSGESFSEVRNCKIDTCPLWAYRFGKSPASAIYQLSKNYDVEIIQ